MDAFAVRAGQTFTFPSETAGYSHHLGMNAIGQPGLTLVRISLLRFEPDPVAGANAFFPRRIRIEQNRIGIRIHFAQLRKKSIVRGIAQRVKRQLEVVESILRNFLPIIETDDDQEN